VGFCRGEVQQTKSIAAVCPPSNYLKQRRRASHPGADDGLVRRVAARTSQFKKFVDSLTKESKSPILNGFRLGQTFKIADVQREANAALQAYEERGSSLRSHFLRTLGRDFSNNASAAEALLEFVPDGEYTFIVCGALTLIFNVRIVFLSSCLSADGSLRLQRRSRNYVSRF